MSTNSEFDSQATPQELVDSNRMGRRRLLRAGLSVAPVVLAVSGRSAMASGGPFNCETPAGLSPMAWASIAPNGVADCSVTSHAIGKNPLGKSPGYWKPNTGGNSPTFQPPYAWPVAPFDQVSTLLPNNNRGTVAWQADRYLDFKGVASDDPGFANGAKFNSVFNVGITDPKNRSFSRILLDDSGSVQWHLCAAYLNCLVMPLYALTLPELLDLSKGKIGSKTGVYDEEIKAFLNQTWN